LEVDRVARIVVRVDASLQVVHADHARVARPEAQR
jgi:hypothetical protein